MAKSRKREAQPLYVKFASGEVASAYDFIPRQRNRSY